MFHRGDVRGLASINKALVTLLLKEDAAEQLRDFRPVSLMHGAVKIFDKVLACRLAQELPNLIVPHQSTFVKGRALHDNSMLVQSMARRLHALKHPTIMLKLDISKSFDTVQWPFLLEVL